MSSTYTTPITTHFTTTVRPVTTITWPPNQKFTAILQVHNGRLPEYDGTSPVDIYLIIFLDNRQIARTPTKHNTHDPKFDYEKRIPVVTSQSVFRFEVWDEDGWRDDYYGKFFIQVSLVVQAFNGTRRHYDIKNGWFAATITLFPT